MQSVLAAPIAKLLVFDLPLHQFLVFGREIIHVLANGTAKPY